MTTRNDITGDKIQSKPNNKAYAEQWEIIYGIKPTSQQPKKHHENHPKPIKHNT